MVFKNGCRPGSNEKWYFKNQKIKISNSYKYLDITLSSNLSLNAHFKRENWTFPNLQLTPLIPILFNKNIAFSSKLHIFNAVLRSIICYAVKLWGNKMYQVQETCLRTFVKKCFSLALNTPGLIKYIETKILPIFLYIIKVHLKYVHRCSQLVPTRHPCMLVNEIIKRKILWCNV